jgi:hypothetical protein
MEHTTCVQHSLGKLGTNQCYFVCFYIEFTKYDKFLYYLFQCWHAASFLKYTELDHRESIALTSDGLNYECNEAPS